MQCPHCEFEIADGVILSEGARIYNRRRHSHKGQAAKSFVCRWCSTLIQTRVGIDQHERHCDARPGPEVTDADLIAWQWPPPDSA
jgi:hypothetical protein